MPLLGSSGRFHATSKHRQRKGHSQNKSRPSGRRARTRNVRFHQRLPAKVRLRPQKPRPFQGSREIVPGPAKRPPERLPGARAPKTPPRALRDGQCAFSIVIYRVKTGLMSKTRTLFNGCRLLRSFQEASCVSAACLMGVPQFSFSFSY